MWNVLLNWLHNNHHKIDEYDITLMRHTLIVRLGEIFLGLKEQIIICAMRLCWEDSILDNIEHKRISNYISI